MASNPVIWFEIYVQDMERAKRFYEAVLQQTLEKLESPDVDMWSFSMEPNGTGATGCLAQMAGLSSGGNSTLVYFRCEDCANEADRVVAAGGRIYREKTSIGPHGFYVLAYDTEDNMFGLHSLR
jgi:uncharacterized protein